MRTIRGKDRIDESRQSITHEKDAALPIDAPRSERNLFLLPGFETKSFREGHRTRTRTETAGTGQLPSSELPASAECWRALWNAAEQIHLATDVDGGCVATPSHTCGFGGCHSIRLGYERVWDGFYGASVSAANCCSYAVGRGLGRGLIRHPAKELRHNVTCSLG